MKHLLLDIKGSFQIAFTQKYDKRFAKYLIQKKNVIDFCEMAVQDEPNTISPVIVNKKYFQGESLY